MHKELEEQTVLNEKMIKRFANLTNHINQQQKIITSYLKYINENSKNQIARDNHNLKYAHYLNQVNYNMNLLHDHITRIAEAIILANLNLISNTILSTESGTIRNSHYIQKSRVKYKVQRKHL